MTEAWQARFRAASLVGGVAASTVTAVIVAVDAAAVGAGVVVTGAMAIGAYTAAALAADLAAAVAAVAAEWIVDWIRLFRSNARSVTRERLTIGDKSHLARRRPGPALAAGDERSRRLVEALVDHLHLRAVALLPIGADRERWAEEWAEHRTHLRGVRLVWWALCTRATASRTAAELRHARLPRPDH